MAYDDTHTTLLTRTLQMACREGAREFMSPAEHTALVNESLAEWVDEVRGTTWNGSYSRSKYSFQTVTNQQLYDLPADFLSLISVDVFIAGGSPVISALCFQEENRNVFRNFPICYGWGFSRPVYYQLQGPQIAFIPLPQGSYTVTLNYTPTAPVLSDPDDAIDSVNGWESFIILDVAIKLLLKAGEHDSIPALEARLSTQRERLRAMAPRRDQYAAETVHCIQNAQEDWGG